MQPVLPTTIDVSLSFTGGQVKATMAAVDAGGMVALLGRRDVLHSALAALPDDVVVDGPRPVASASRRAEGWISRDYICFVTAAVDAT